MKHLYNAAYFFELFSSSVIKRLNHAVRMHNDMLQHIMIIAINSKYFSITVHKKLYILNYSVLLGVAQKCKI